MSVLEPLSKVARVWLALLAWILLLPSFSSRAFSQQAPSVSAATGQPNSPVNAAPPQAPTPTQQTPQASPSSPQPKRLNCQHSADPHRRHAGCKDKDFDWDDVLTSSWDGIRDTLRQFGLSPTLSYMGALQTNVTGRPHQIWGYAGQLVGGLNVDLEKLLKVRGMSVYFAGSWGTGDNLSGPLNTLFPVNTLYAPTYYLGEMYVQQVLLNNRLTLAGGRLGPSNTFATLPVLNNYVNYGLNPNPYPLGGNDITFLAPPAGTEWGVQATYDVTPVIQVAAGLFNNNLNSANGQNHGTDWTLQQGNKGALVVAQISYFPHQIENDQGKQGEYTVGFITNNNSFPTLPDGAGKSSGYAGAFVLGQEMVYQPDGANNSRGLTVWGSWAYNSKPLIGYVPVFWGAGASYQGLIPSRKNDIASAGWIYGRVSNSVPGAGAEQALELNYRWSHHQFLAITPDFQYIWKPGGYSVPGIALLGVQASVTF